MTRFVKLIMKVGDTPTWVNPDQIVEVLEWDRHGGPPVTHIALSSGSSFEVWGTVEEVLRQIQR